MRSMRCFILNTYWIAESLVKVDWFTKSTKSISYLFMVNLHHAHRHRMKISVSRPTAACVYCLQVPSRLYFFSPQLTVKILRRRVLIAWFLEWLGLFPTFTSDLACIGDREHAVDTGWNLKQIWNRQLLKQRLPCSTRSIICFIFFPGFASSALCARCRRRRTGPGDAQRWLWCHQGLHSTRLPQSGSVPNMLGRDERETTETTLKSPGKIWHRTFIDRPM